MSVTLELLTSITDNHRRDVEVADPTLLIPTNALALQQGEWLVPNSSGKMVRVTTSVAGAKQIFSQKGDTAAQAIGKICVLQLHAYEAETTIFADGLTPAIGDNLTVKASTVDGVSNVSALAAAGSGEFVYAIVTRTPAQNGGKLRYEVLPSLIPLA